MGELISEKEVTVDYLQSVFPSRKGSITQELADMINRSKTEPEFQGESILSSAFTYENILTGTKHGMKDYINAIRFCAYLMSQKDNYTEAYKKTFFYRDFVQARLNVDKQSSAYNELTFAASRYRSSKLVKDLLTLSQLPLDLMFTGARYRAIGVLADLSINAKFDKDRIAAAKELLIATKNDDQKVTLEIGQTEAVTSMQESLYEQLQKIGANQLMLINAGVSLKEVQRVNVDLDVKDGEVT